MATRLVLLLLLASASVAHAQPGLTPPGLAAPEVPASAPPRAFKLQLAAHGGLRFTGLDGHAASASGQLEDYGWPSTRSPVLAGYGVDAQYLWAPLVDVGLAYAWARGDHAAGLAWMEDRVTTTTRQLGLVARLHWAKGRPFVPEPRVEVGALRVTTTLHEVDDTRTVPYLRGGLDWRLGTRRAGVQLAVGYTLTGRASPGELDLATGGLDLELGPYLRF